ncbi:MAG: ATP-binding protein [Sphaerochaeta sp.]|nr:ATP-binding protein [Sphaerochaeta sp.]
MRYESIESKILEFNERLDDYSRLLETVVAFANTQGGTIIIGIRDSDRLIVGLHREEIERYSQEIPQVIADAVSPQIAVDLYAQHLGGKTCVTIRVFPGPQKPHFLKRLGYPSGVFLRFGAHNRKADSYAIEQFSRIRSGIRYEQQPCPQISYEELSKELLGTLFSRYDQAILIGAGYGSNEVSGRTIPNVAGTLLFYPEHQKIIPESGVVVSVYATKDKRQLIKKEEFSGGIMPMLEAAYTFLSTLLGTHYEREGLIKAPVNHEIPLDAIREALVNAVAHRAYDYEAPTRITLFSDRIEFLNPGNFYAPINAENLKEGLSRYRNPLIADALRKKGYMEKQGIGINLIISSCLEAGLSEPQFVELEHHVKLVIFRRNSAIDHVGTPHDPHDITTMRRHFTALGLFSSKDLAQYLGRSGSMAKKILFDLRQQGVIEKVGKGPATKYQFIK